MPNLAISDPWERLVQTYCALLLWVEQPDIQKVVLCDSTGAGSFFCEVVDAFAARGKELEVLSFVAPFDEVRSLGKGYAEGLILEHALTHSNVLRSSPAFYKITGRLFIENFSAVRRSESSPLPAFVTDCRFYELAALRVAHTMLPSLAVNARGTRWQRLFIPGAYTTFWFSPVDYFRLHLSDCHLDVCDKKQFFIEHAVFARLMRFGMARFPESPRIVGRSGTQGRLYSGIDYPTELRDAVMEVIGHHRERLRDLPCTSGPLKLPEKT